MKTRQEKRPDLTGPCRHCNDELVITTSVNNQPGVVSDGDNVNCLTDGCSAAGTLCGAPSDGIGVIWESQNSQWCRSEFEDLGQWKAWFDTGNQEELTDAIGIMERVVALTGQDSDYAKIRKPYLEYAFNKMNERFPDWMEEAIPF